MIDHLVYCVPDLEKAMNDFEQRSGIRPVFGGYHTTQGTKNALVRLSGNTYLEFLAIDENNENVMPPRWMGIDLLQGPKMTRWALKSNQLAVDAACLKSYDPKMGEITSGQRTITTGAVLRWEIAMPLVTPEVEVAPFLLDWSTSSSYPADDLADGCQLIELLLFHPEPEVITQLLTTLKMASKSSDSVLAEIVVRKGTSKIQARLHTPKGELIL